MNIDNFKSRREALGFPTASAFAAFINMSPKSVQHWERKDSIPPWIDRMLTLAEALKEIRDTNPRPLKLTDLIEHSLE